MKRDKEGCNYRNGKCCYHCQFFLVPSSEVLSKMNVFLLMLGAFTDVAIVTPPFLSMSRSRRRPARAFNGLAVPRYTPNRSRCARSGVHARDSWICCYETDKKVGVRRPPTAFLLPIVARMEIRRFRLRGSLHQAYITLRCEGRTKTRIRYSSTGLVVIANCP